MKAYPVTLDAARGTSNRRQSGRLHVPDLPIFDDLFHSRVVPSPGMDTRFTRRILDIRIQHSVVDKVR